MSDVYVHQQVVYITYISSTLFDGDLVHRDCENNR